MESQHGTVERIVDQLAEPQGDVADSRGTGDPGLAHVSPVQPAPGRGVGAMSRLDTSDEAPAASLVGSLSVFTLADVLSMLASTMQTGELQVVSEECGRAGVARPRRSLGRPGRNHIDHRPGGLRSGLRDRRLVLLHLGLGDLEWAATGAGRTVLTEVGPQVDEWRELQKAVPLEAVVALCPDPPGQDVQIRSDQWRVLTTVGNSGLTVKSVLDMIGEDQIAGLRTLRELDGAGLIELRTPVPPADDDPAPTYDFSSGNGSALGTVPPPAPTPPSPPTPTSSPPFPRRRGLDTSAASGDKPYGSLAEVAMMPPPIADDPWAHTTKSNGSDDNGAA